MKGETGSRSISSNGTHQLSLFPPDVQSSGLVAPTLQEAHFVPEGKPRSMASPACFVRVLEVFVSSRGAVSPNGEPHSLQNLEPGGMLVFPHPGQMSLTSRLLSNSSLRCWKDFFLPGVIFGFKLFGDSLMNLNRRERRKM